MRVVACIEDERVARQILAHLGLSRAVPGLKPARDPPQTEFEWGAADGADLEPDYAMADPIPEDLN